MGWGDVWKGALGGNLAGVLGGDPLLGAVTGAAIGGAKSASDAKGKQQSKGGIQNPVAEYQNYETGGGLQRDSADQWAPSRFKQGQAGGGGYAQAPEGFDYASPGVAEQYFQQQQGRTMGPGQANQYWNQVRGQFNGPTHSERVGGSGTDAYYDRAASKVQGQLNNQLAATGSLGSSMGNNQVADAIAGLRAREAMDAANYDLQAAGQMDQSRAQMMGLGGSLAGTADSADLGRFQGGMNAAMAAQDARRVRGQDMFGNVYAPAAQLAGMAGNTYGQMIGADQELMDAALAAELGLSREMLNQSYQKADRQKDDEKHGMSMAKDFMSFFGGGMGGG